MKSTLRDELERIDEAVHSGRAYGFEQTIFRRMLDTLDQVDALGLAISDAGYVWTPEMRAAYERATEGMITRGLPQEEPR